jgi:hypothetical protein
LWDENVHINKDYGDPLPLEKPGKRKNKERRKEGRKEA